jgi:TPR repeat protein
VKNVFSVLLLCFLLASCGEETKIRERAEAGDVEAQKKLAAIYFKPSFLTGVSKDAPEAVKWMRKAAEQGDAEAQFNLGVVYFQGDGVPQYDAIAYMFFNLAAAKDYENAEKYIDLIEKRTTKEQIAEGQKLTREWLERKAKEKGE